MSNRQKVAPRTRAPAAAKPPSATPGPAPSPTASVLADSDAAKESGGVIAVTRALQLLEAFALGESHLSLALLSRRCGLHKAVA